MVWPVSMPLRPPNQHHLKIVTGGGAESVELPYFVWVNTMLSNVKNAMHGTVSRDQKETSAQISRRILLQIQPKI
jgi:hypothetical protein